MDDDIILMPSIGRVFLEVAKTGISGLVPLENSEAGGVTATMDGLMQHELYITKEAYLPVHHSFAADTPKDQISVIFAHPQSHEQCSKYIDSLGLPVIHTESNAASGQAQKERANSAAIISESLAKRYEIPIIDRNIENNLDNITRFIVISSIKGTDAYPQKCSIIADPGENRAGLLYDLLSPFKDSKVNLTRIESRPSKRCMGNYVFFIDIQCEGAWMEAIEKISRITRIKHLGCYQVLGEFPCR